MKWCFQRFAKIFSNPRDQETFFKPFKDLSSSAVQVTTYINSIYSIVTLKVVKNVLFEYLYQKYISVHGRILFIVFANPFFVML